MNCAQGLFYLQARSEIFARDTAIRIDATTSRGGNVDVEGSRIHFYEVVRQPSLDFSGLVDSSVHIAGGGTRERAGGPVFEFINALVEQKTLRSQNLRGDAKNIISCGSANSLLK